MPGRAEGGASHRRRTIPRLPRLPAPLSPDHPESGTTLVELLVALALFALMALFLGQGISALRQMAPVSKRIDAAADVSVVREHLGQVLGEALGALPAASTALFEGRPGRITFLAPGDPLLEVGGVARIVLSIEPGPGGGVDLVERRRVERDGAGKAPGTPTPQADASPAHADGSAGEPDDGTGEALGAGEAAGPPPTILIGGLSAARFAFAGPVTGEAPEWRETWRERGLLPALVRIEWTAPGERALAPIVVHPGNADTTDRRPPGANAEALPPESPPASPKPEATGTP